MQRMYRHRPMPNSPLRIAVLTRADKRATPSRSPRQAPTLSSRIRNLQRRSSLLEAPLTAYRPSGHCRCTDQAPRLHRGICVLVGRSRTIGGLKPKALRRNLGRTWAAPCYSGEGRAVLRVSVSRVEVCGSVARDLLRKTREAETATVRSGSWHHTERRGRFTCRWPSSRSRESRPIVSRIDACSPTSSTTAVSAETSRRGFDSSSRASSTTSLHQRPRSKKTTDGGSGCGEKRHPTGSLFPSLARARARVQPSGSSRSNTPQASCRRSLDAGMCRVHGR